MPPLFPAKLTKWAEYPVLSKPITIRGMIAKNGASRTDVSIGEQLRQRAMGGERERAQLRGLELLVNAITRWL